MTAASSVGSGLNYSGTATGSNEADDGTGMGFGSTTNVNTGGSIGVTINCNELATYGCTLVNDGALDSDSTFRCRGGQIVHNCPNVNVTMGPTNIHNIGKIIGQSNVNAHINQTAAASATTHIDSSTVISNMVKKLGKTNTIIIFVFAGVVVLGLGGYCVWHFTVGKSNKKAAELGAALSKKERMVLQTHLFE